MQLKMRTEILFKVCSWKSALVMVGAVLMRVLMASTNCVIISWKGQESMRREEFHAEFLKAGCNASIRNHLLRLTADPHVAGTTENFATAEYVLSTFERYGLDAHYTDYRVLLSYPLRRSLTLSLSGGHTVEFDLQERDFDRNPKAIPAFHAYSPSGSVTAQVVYVNYGRVEDFAKLYELGVSVSGAIAIARCGRIYRGDIIQNAADAGAVGVVVYPDPQDYAASGAEGYYPESKWLDPSGVQRGSVFQYFGDPLTPGWASTPRSERLAGDNLRAVLPSIPSLPISAENAQGIMLPMGGPVAPLDWQGALDLPVYRTGPGFGILTLSYVANHTVTPIRNVFAVIRGSEEPDRYVLLGNHRDAWTFGAVDANSGTAALLEIARRFGKLLTRGWRPRRSIILCNWDAEEYGLVGSTEWVEQNSDLLISKAVAYLNVDTAVGGPGFVASATPQLDELLEQVTKQVEDPDDSSRTVYQSWIASSDKSINSLIGRLAGRGSSDYASFLQHIGVPAMDIYFGKDDNPVYHSLYDNFYWMENFGDPLFHRHVAVATIWGLATLKLADEEVLPFNYETYAAELQSYTRSLGEQLKIAVHHRRISLSPLYKSVAKLRKVAKGIVKQQKELKRYGYELVGPLRYRALNDRLMMAERAFTDSDGLPEKSWYKHLIYGPSNDSKSVSYPSVCDLLQNAIISNSTQAWLTVQHEIWRISRGIIRVAQVLHGEPT